MKRYGALVRLRPEAIAEYKRIHAAVWPKVLEQIKRSNISNDTIFLREPANLLFGYFEVDDLAASTAYLADSEIAAEWEAESAGFFTQLDGRPDQAFVELREVFHLD